MYPLFIAVLVAKRDVFEKNVQDVEEFEGLINDEYLKLPALTQEQLCDSEQSGAVSAGAGKPYLVM